MQNPKNSRDSARWPITISSTSSTSPPRLIIPAPTPTAVHTSNGYPPPPFVDVDVGSFNSLHAKRCNPNPEPNSFQPHPHPGARFLPIARGRPDADADAEEGGRRKVSRENVRRKSAGIGAGLLGGGGQKSRDRRFCWMSNEDVIGIGECRNCCCWWDLQAKL